MNIRDLRYIVAVAELRSFSAAAKYCHISQPTLSAQIKKVEQYLGVVLFERTSRKMLLTDVGVAVSTAAKRALQEIDAIKEIAQYAHDPMVGKFRLGAFPTLAMYLFPSVVVEMKRSLPQLRLILIEEKTAVLLQQLKQGKLDAALLALPVEDELLQTQFLFEDPFLLAVPSQHALAHRKRVDVSVLARVRLLLLEEGHCLREQALSVCEFAGGVEEEFRGTSLETLRQMVKAGTGVTLMPKIAISKQEEGICYILFKSPAPKRSIALVWRKTNPRLPLMRALAALLTTIDYPSFESRRAKSSSWNVRV